MRFQKKIQSSGDNIPTATLVKIKTHHDAFLWMVKAAERNPNSFDIAKVISEYWPLAFETPIPEGNANEIILKIRYGLMYSGYINHGHEMPSRMKQNYDYFVHGKGEPTNTTKLLNKCEQTNYFSNIKIYSQNTEEDFMSTKKATKKSNVPANVKGINTRAKAKSKKTVAVKKESPKAEKTQSATGYVIELLLQKKSTDEQIMEMTQRKFPARNEKQIKVYISCQRNDLNSGRKKGLKAGDKLERLVDVDGKVVPYSKKPKKVSKGTRSVDPKTDPLKKVAGIDVHGKKAKAAKAVKKDKKLAKKKAKFAKKA